MGIERMKIRISKDPDGKKVPFKNSPFQLLISALKNNKYKDAFLLIRNSIGVNGKDAQDNTPLHYAVGWNNLKIIKFLVNSGADVNAMNVNRVTALHLACRRLAKEAIRYLIENGAVLNIKDNQGKTPRKDVCHESYLQTRRWGIKRRQAILFWGGKCLYCGNRSKINVHHRNYDNLGNEDPANDLMILCYECHKKMHIDEKNLKFAQIEQHLEEVKKRKEEISGGLFI
jgi:5-methylcytosine-specific restriction endonuclease McrA